MVAGLDLRFSALLKIRDFSEPSLDTVDERNKQAS